MAEAIRVTTVTDSNNKASNSSNLNPHTAVAAMTSMHHPLARHQERVAMVLFVKLELNNEYSL
jgi:hypothetical protein